MSPCSRVCLPRNSSSAQPAATHHGVATPARRWATSLGVQQDDHLAGSASISADDNSVPPSGGSPLDIAKGSVDEAERVPGRIREDPEALAARAQPARAQLQGPRLAGVQIVDEEVEVGLLRVGWIRPAGRAVFADPLEHQAPA